MKPKPKKKTVRKVGGSGLFPKVKITKKAYQKGAATKSKIEQRSIGFKPKKTKAKKNYKTTGGKKG